MAHLLNMRQCEIKSIGIRSHDPPSFDWLVKKNHLPVILSEKPLRRASVIPESQEEFDAILASARMCSIYIVNARALTFDVIGERLFV